MWHQQRALVRRYCIIISYNPIKSFTRLILWPSFMFWGGIYLLDEISLVRSRDEPTSHSMNIPSALTIFFVPWFAGLLIKDKAFGMKKLMLAMGLTRFDHHCANSICFHLYVLPLSLGIAITTKVHLLDETVSWPSIILVFALFALHLDSAVSVLLSFIEKQKFSSVFLVLIFFETLLEYLILDSNETYKPIKLLFSSISPYQPVRIFILSNMNSQVQTGAQSVKQDLPTVFIEQVVWTIILRFLACWFEEVHLRQMVSAVMGPYFCFSQQKCHQSKSIEDPLDDIATTFNYFEDQAPNSEVGIKISDVTKVFKNTAALKDVSFSIYKGETTLLLGHNGAGKTTLMNIILGWLNPDHGNVKIRRRPNGMASVGVCPQTSILDDILTVRQHLELFNDIKSNISGPERERHIQQTIDDVSLGEHVDKRPPELSGGMKRKLSLAMALVGKSDVLILDEPSSGLDPDSRMLIWNAIRRYRADRTVLLSTQHMEEADYLGDRVAIMRGGQIVCCGSSVYLNKLFGTGYKLRIECKQSKTKEILDHIRSYFDGVKSEGIFEDPASEWETCGNVDFIVKLAMNDKDADAELQLIELLKDLESNSSTLGVHLYGLKSSSIEDVMLNINRSFSAPDSKDVTFLRTCKILAGRPTRSKIIRALCIKQLQVYRTRWLFVIMLKILVPVSAIYEFVNSISGPALSWHSALTAFMIRHFVRLPAKEHLSKFKIMQLKSGASVWLYWQSQVIVDFLFVIIYLVTANIFLITNVEASFLVPKWQVHLLVSLATLLFCLASMMFCYMLSAISRNAEESGAYIVLIYIASTFMLGVRLYSDGWLRACYELWHIFSMFVPISAYQDYLSGLGEHCHVESLQSSHDASISLASEYDIFLGLAGLVLHTLLYASLLYAIEMHKIDISWYLRPKNTLSCIFRRTRSAASSTLVETDKDVDDENERALFAIKAPTVGSNSLTAAKLNKSYYKDTKIIQDLSFTVKKGECFGLLGVNGAGKSTTFSMLAAEMRPDSGRILANGQYLDENLHKYRSKLGYDPQSNPEMSLTAYQAMSLMARLRGIEESCVPALIESISDLLEMREHINKMDFQLSGGTKRKLALGMALIGNPSLLLLDEPTAGVDPFARRAVWRLLRSLKKRSNVSIVISSQAMEECEAICDRISIMARGRLRCIGSFLHLRSRFAPGFTIKVQFGMEPFGNLNLTVSSDSTTLSALSGDPSSYFRLRRQPVRFSSEVGVDDLLDSSVSELKQLLDSAIGSNNYKLSDENATSLTFEIMDSKVKRSMLFETMRQFRQRHPNVSYVINDLSLEDIFIAVAREETCKKAHDPDQLLINLN